MTRVLPLHAFFHPSVLEPLLCLRAVLTPFFPSLSSDSHMQDQTDWFGT